MDNDDFIENCERHELIEVAKHQAIVKRLQVINVQIQAYEAQYHGTFQDFFGHLSNIEIDGLSNSVDITGWKELVEERKRLIEELDKDDIPDGIYAVPRDPDQPRIQVRRLHEHCRVHGLSPSQLSKAEIAQFLVYPTKDEREHD